jgi:hypothetical protein
VYIEIIDALTHIGKLIGGIMLINYDPDGKPIFTDDIIEEAEQLRLHPVLILCDEPRAQVGDPTGVSFIALVAFIPRQGDRIVLEDGRVCEVSKVYYKVLPRKDTHGKTQSILLVPNVTAYLLPDSPEQSSGNGRV